MCPTRANRTEYERPFLPPRQPNPVPTIQRLHAVWIDQGTRVVPGVLIGWQAWSRGWYGQVVIDQDGEIVWSWVQASRLRRIGIADPPPKPGFGG